MQEIAGTEEGHRYEVPLLSNPLKFVSEAGVFCLKINPMRRQGRFELGEICQVTIRKQQTCWQKRCVLNRVELFLYGNFDTERVIMLDVTNYMLSNQSSTNQSKVTANKQLFNSCDYNDLTEQRELIN